MNGGASVFALIIAMLCGELPTVESADFPRAVQLAAIRATVMIHCDKHGEGSGVLLWSRGPSVYVLTAAHVVEPGHRLEVYTFAENTYPRPANLIFGAEIVARSLTDDLALLRLPTRDMMPDAVRVGPPDLALPENGFLALTAGCDKGAAPTCQVDEVIGVRRVRKEPRSGVTTVWEIRRRPVVGRSGGPLLDQHSRLLGICSGTTDEKGYYSHLDTIRGFLRANGMAWIVNDGKGS